MNYFRDSFARLKGFRRLYQRKYAFCRQAIIPVGNAGLWSCPGIWKGDKISSIDYFPTTSMVAPSGSITNSETSIAKLYMPPNSLQAGAGFMLTAYGTVTSTVANSITINIRIGTTTLTGTIPLAFAATGTTSASSAPFQINAFIVIRTTGASGTILGHGAAITNTTAGATQAFSLAQVLGTATSVAVNTTVSNLIELTCVTGASTTAVTFQNVCFEYSAAVDLTPFCQGATPESSIMGPLATVPGVVVATQTGVGSINQVNGSIDMTPLPFNLMSGNATVQWESYIDRVSLATSSSPELLE